MKRLLVALATLTVAAASCSKTESAGPLSTGFYESSHFKVNVDTCSMALTSGLSAFQVTAADGGVEMELGGVGSTPFSLHGTTLTDDAPLSPVVTDWTTSAQQVATVGFALAHNYNCLMTETVVQSGTVIGTDTFNLLVDEKWSLNAGASAAACAAAVASDGVMTQGVSLTIDPISLPCETETTVTYTECPIPGCELD